MQISKEWKEDEDVKIGGEGHFRVNVHHVKAINLTTRHRFKEELKLYCQFDDKKFKSKRVQCGGGDVEWKNFSWKMDDFLVYNIRFLQEKTFTIDIGCKHDKNELVGSVSVDLYTLATGPVDHNLPLTDAQGKNVGRLEFSVEMEHVTNVAVIFREVKLKGLASLSELKDSDKKSKKPETDHKKNGRHFR